MFYDVISDLEWSSVVPYLVALPRPLPRPALLLASGVLSIMLVSVLLSSASRVGLGSSGDVVAVVVEEGGLVTCLNTGDTQDTLQSRVVMQVRGETG